MEIKIISEIFYFFGLAFGTNLSKTPKDCFCVVGFSLGTSNNFCASIDWSMNS